MSLFRRIPKQLARAFKTAGISRPATLIVMTPGARVPGAYSAGTNPTETSYSCSATIAALTVDDVPGAPLVNKHDRRLSIIGATCAVIPTPGDKVTITDLDGVSKTFRLIDPIEGSGSGATYTFVARL